MLSLNAHPHDRHQVADARVRSSIRISDYLYRPVQIRHSRFVEMDLVGMPPEAMKLCPDPIRDLEGVMSIRIPGDEIHMHCSP
jgi:hypothetical protein